MATLTVRIDKDTHKILRDMARQSGESMPSILAKVVEQYRRKHFPQEDKQQTDQRRRHVLDELAAHDQELGLE